MLFKPQAEAPTPLGGTEVAAKLLNGIFSNGVSTILSRVASRISGMSKVWRMSEAAVWSDLSIRGRIVAQRAFQAKTRTVSVANRFLANLVALGQ